MSDNLDVLDETPVEQEQPKKNLFGKIREFSSEDKGNFDALLSYSARTPPMAIVLDAFVCSVAILLLYLLLRA